MHNLVQFQTALALDFTADGKTDRAAVSVRVLLCPKAKTNSFIWVRKEKGVEGASSRPPRPVCCSCTLGREEIYDHVLWKMIGRERVGRADEVPQ